MIVLQIIEFICERSKINILARTRRVIRVKIAKLQITSTYTENTHNRLQSIYTAMQVHIIEPYVYGLEFIPNSTCTEDAGSFQYAKRSIQSSLNPQNIYIIFES